MQKKKNIYIYIYIAIIIRLLFSWQVLNIEAYS